MTITINLPEEMAVALGSTPADQEQRAREAIALELYREGRISLRTMGRMAGLGDDYWAADQFRVRHCMPLADVDTAIHEDEESIRDLIGA